MSLSADFPTTRPSLLLDFLNTQALDPRITFTRATSATYFDAAGVLRSAPAGQARFDYNPSTLTPLGLLIEEQRTNSIRNNTMVGAVVGVIGSGGSLPTNWSAGGTTTGLTISVIGTGTENGINYIDIRFNGTAGAALNPNILFDTSTGIVAANGQSWSWSSYVSLVGGSLSNVTSIIGVQIMFNNVPASIGTLSGSPFVPTNATLNTQRQTFTTTLNQATTAYVRPTLQFSVANGAAIDITLRIGLPQLELGAFATSVIPTTGSAATRNADAASMTGTNFSSWYNAGGGTIYAESSRYVAGISNAQCVVCEFGVNASNNDNLIQLGSQFNTTNFQFLVNANNVGQCAIVEAGTTSLSKYVAAYEINNFAYTKNGATVSTDTLGIVPIVNQFNIGSRPAFGNTGFLNGHIRRIAYYPVRLSNAQLQALTS